MPILCENNAEAALQAARLRELLLHLDTLSPQLLREHNIDPREYHAGLVFRTAIETIRGTFIASAQGPREAFVRSVLDHMQQRRLIRQYNYLGRDPESRIDFRVELNSGRSAAIEVKGGEGNSWNISERPSWAHEYIAWGHLNGSLKSPAAGVLSIIATRVAQDLLRGKRFDCIIFKDALCGTITRPCPKYAPDTPNERVAPDIFLLPQQTPPAGQGCGVIHDRNTLEFPFLLLKFYNVAAKDIEQHLWRVALHRDRKDRRRNYLLEIMHLNQLVG